MFQSRSCFEFTKETVEFKIRRLRTTTTDKHATAHDQNHVTVHFFRVVLRSTFLSDARQPEVRYFPS